MLFMIERKALLFLTLIMKFKYTDLNSEEKAFVVMD